MSDPIADFLDHMRAVGCAPASPSDIKPDNIFHVIDGINDRKNSKKIRYVLKIDEGRAVGGCLNYREGEWHTFTSKANGREYSAEEKAAWKARIDAERERQDKEEQEKYKEAARIAKLVWDGANAATADHPYLKRKQIQPHGMRVYNGDLLVPMYYQGTFRGVQTITPDGDKFFAVNYEDKWYGTSSKSCFYVLAHKDDDKGKILLVEGFATAASVREATGLITVMAFNAGNLSEVAQHYRDKYPKARIVTCADNDQWSPDGKHADKVDRSLPGDDPKWAEWREEGYLRNTGLEKAEQAALRIKGHLIWPEIPDNDPLKRSDWNDLHVTEGLDAVAARIMQAFDPPKPSKEITESDLDSATWVERCIMKLSSKGEPYPDPKKSYNYFIIVQNHPRLQGIFVWDEFRELVMAASCPPWQEEDKFKPRPIMDVDYSHCDFFLQRACGMAGSRDNTRAAIYAAADKNRQHPVRQKFDLLNWDGVPRLDKWLIEYCHCTADDQDYVRAVGRTWMIAAVKRIYEPGCKFDHMLVLEGAQAFYKSTALRELATFDDGYGTHVYFTDAFQLTNCTDKDEKMKLRGVLIVEIKEMAGFGKKDQDTLKGFVDATEDEYRKVHGYENQKFPRQFVLAGTYNPVDGLFTDPTGHRRYWVVEVTDRIKISDLRRDKEQLWAEAVHRYKHGESLILSETLYKKAHEAGEQRMQIDPWNDDVLSSCRYKDFVVVSDVLRDLEVPKRGKSQAESRRVGKILLQAGFKRLKKRGIWGWVPPDKINRAPTQLFEEEQEIAFSWFIPAVLFLYQHIIEWGLFA